MWHVRRRHGIAHCRGPRFDPQPRPLEDPQKASDRCSRYPIRQFKGRYRKAELGLSDRLTPLADYWI